MAMVGPDSLYGFCHAVERVGFTEAVSVVSTVVSDAVEQRHVLRCVQKVESFCACYDGEWES